VSLHLFSLDEKIEAMTLEVERVRKLPRPFGSPAQRRHEILKAVLADLRARAIFPKSQPLGELERALVKMKESKTALGYETGQMIAVTGVLVNKWPFIRQALEQYGEESAE
jgi:hypothetical protein